MKTIIKTVDLGVCICGQPISASVEGCAVIHDMPLCQKFLDLEPDEFLTYVRRSRGIPDGAVDHVQ
jgi:hypothetical protein